jgi:hypothetical protein
MKCVKKLEIALENIDFSNSVPNLRSIETVEAERVIYASGLTRNNVAQYVSLLRDHTAHCIQCSSVYVDYVKANKGDKSFREAEKGYLGILG